MPQEAEHDRMNWAGVDRVERQMSPSGFEPEIVGESPAGRVEVEVVPNSREEAGLEPDSGQDVRRVSVSTVRTSPSSSPGRETLVSTAPRLSISIPRSKNRARARSVTVAEPATGSRYSSLRVADR